MASPELHQQGPQWCSVNVRSAGPREGLTHVGFSLDLSRDSQVCSRLMNHRGQTALDLRTVRFYFIKITTRFHY